MFYSRSSGFLCATFRALAKWNKIRTHFRIITAVKPKGKQCITSPLHSTHTFIRIKQIICFPFFSRQDPQQQYLRMSATYFPYYPHPQYGSQLQGAQEIHSSSVRPHSDLPGSQLQENSHSSSISTGPKKKNRWTNTEEKILVELFGENEDKLRYKAFSSSEWLSIARQLHSRCKEQNVDSDKTPQQCKNKLTNLTKKYKNTKDKLRSTGYGRGGYVPSDNESLESENIIPKHFNDMDEILSKRESINPRHVLESSHVPDSKSPEMSELTADFLQKDAQDEKICRAAQKQRQGTAQNVSPPSECTVTSDAD